MALTVIGSAPAAFTVGTSQGVAVPAGTQGGDCLVLVGFARSALTPPTGFSVVASRALDDGGATGQVLYTLVGHWTGDAALVVQQAAESRMAFGLVVLRGNNGWSVVGSGTRAAAGGALPAASCAAPRAGVAVVAQSVDSVSGATQTHAVPAGYTQGSTLTTAESRMAFGWANVGAGTVAPGDFARSAPSSFSCAVTVVIAEPDAASLPTPGGAVAAAAAAYPVGLPRPLASKSRSQPAAFSIREPRRGMGYVQQTGTDVPAFWDLQWVLSTSDAQRFYLWFLTALQRGVLPFTMPLATEFGDVEHQLQFLPDGLLDHGSQAGVHTYSARVMARRLVVPQSALDSAEVIMGLPDWLAWADALDRAVAALPEAA